MQNIEQLTRELCAALQLSPEYVRTVVAREQNDADEALQAQMSEIELVRMQYQHELKKEDADESLIDGYQTKFQALYQEIMKNDHMQEYQFASGELDKLIKRVMGILQACANGEDPETFEPEAEGCASGNCGGCKGCG